MNEEQKDERLWKMARRRAEFKKSLFSYIAINVFLWAIWWFTTGQFTGFNTPLPWPIWVMLGWGIGLAFQYFKAYNGDSISLTEQEYERLKKDKNA